MIKNDVLSKIKNLGFFIKPIVLYFLFSARTYSQTASFCYEWKGRPYATSVYYGIERLSLFSDHHFIVDTRSYTTKSAKKQNRPSEPIVTDGEWESNHDTLRLIFRNSKGKITRVSTYKKTARGSMYDATFIPKDKRAYNEEKRYYNKLKRRLWHPVQCSS